MQSQKYDFFSTWAQGTALYEEWADKNGIGSPELFVLYALYTRGELTQKEIGNSYGLLKQTVHTVIRSLRQKGYIILKQSEKDKREKFVSLTDSGMSYAKNILTPLLEMEERVYKNIGFDRLAQMQETMELFNILFEKELERN